MRTLFEQRLLPLASGVDAVFVALWWLHTFRSFTTPRLLFDCLVDRFGKPLCRFNALAPLDARLSGSQRNAIVSRTRARAPKVCYVAAALQHASDFLADSELFADCCAFLAQVSGAGARTHAPCRANTASRGGDHQPRL